MTSGGVLVAFSALGLCNFLLFGFFGRDCVY